MHLLISWGKKKEKIRRREKRKEKKIVRLPARVLNSNTVYQRIELTRKVCMCLERYSLLYCGARAVINEGEKKEIYF